MGYRCHGFIHIAHPSQVSNISSRICLNPLQCVGFVFRLGYMQRIKRREALGPL